MNYENGFIRELLVEIFQTARFPNGYSESIFTSQLLTHRIDKLRWKSLKRHLGFPTGLPQARDTNIAVHRRTHTYTHKHAHTKAHTYMCVQERAHTNTHKNKHEH